MKRNGPIGVILTIMVIILGGLLTLMAPLLYADLEPSLYSLNTLLSEDHIQDNYRLVSSFTFHFNIELKIY